MPDLDDLFERFRRDGDPDALAEVYDQTAARLLRAAMHVTDSVTAAEDLLQATFLAAIEQRNRYDAERTLLPWLLGILANQARTARWRESRTPDPERVIGRAAPADPIDQVARLEFTETIDAAIDTLPEHYRSVLVLHLRHGMAPTDIAHALRRSPGTVRAQLARGLERLRNALPASLASSAALTLSTGRGLAAVREAVIACSPNAPATLGGTLLLGGLAMKKVLLLVSVAAVAAIVTTLQWSPADPGTLPTPEPIEPPAAMQTASASTPVAPVTRDVVSTDPEILEGLEALPTASETTDDVPGLVVWSDRTPAAGVPIYYYGIRDPAGDRRTVISDDQGRFSIHRERSEVYIVGSFRGGQGSVTPDESSTLIVIPDGFDVRGRVVDGNRQPVANARIWLSDQWRIDVGTRVATTDDEGRFALRSVGPDRWIGARCRGYRPSVVRYLQAEIGEQVEIEIALARGDARVHGRVFDGQGQPHAGALVRVSPPGEPPAVTASGGGTARAWAPAHARTDETGAFAIDGLPPGDLLVQARAAGHGIARAHLEVPEGVTGEVSVSLPPAAVLAGKIARDDGTFVSGAIVWTGRRHDDFARVQTATDREGGFRLEDIDPGEVHLNVSVDHRTRHEETLHLAPGQIMRWNPIISSAPTITGEVVDANGVGLADWLVFARDDERQVGQTTTDARGAFALAGLTAGPYTIIAARLVTGEHQLFPATMQGARAEGVGVGTRGLRLEVDSMPDRRVFGRVVGPDGEVVAQARVGIGNKDAKGVVNLKVDDADGTFEVSGLPAGSYWITVHAEGYPQITVGYREVMFDADLDLGEIRLSHGQHCGGRLDHGVVTSLDGLELTIIDDRHRPVGTVTTDGRQFESNQLIPGNYVLRVKGDHIAVAATPFEIVAGQDTVLNLDLQPAIHRTIVATLPPNATDPEWVWLTLMRADRVVTGGKLDRQADGSYATTIGFAPDPYRIMIGTDENRYWGMLDATITAGDHSPLHVELKPPPR